MRDRAFYLKYFSSPFQASLRPVSGITSWGNKNFKNKQSLGLRINKMFRLATLKRMHGKGTTFSFVELDYL